LFSDRSVWAHHWIVQRVDPASDVGLYISMKRNRTGSPLAHISYYDHAQKRLKYAKQRSGTPGWDIQVVDAGNVGEYSSLALDSNNLPHITYYDAETHSLKYARQTVFGTWVRTVVDSGGVGKHTSIALDSKDLTHISYYDQDQKQLKYANASCATTIPPLKGGLLALSFLSCEWAIEVIDTGEPRFFKHIGPEIVAGPTSIALDSHDRPHIGYSKKQGVAYATKRLEPGGGWDREHFTTFYGEGADVSLVLDSNDLPHILIRAANGDDEGRVAHQWKQLPAQEVWEDKSLISDPGPPAARGGSIALFAFDERPRISFAGNHGGPIFCIRVTTGPTPKGEFPEWSCSTVHDVAGVLGSYSVIVLDNSKTDPRIAYYDEGLRTVKFALQGPHDHGEDE
jgi:hypothetical protein